MGVQLVSIRTKMPSAVLSPVLDCGLDDIKWMRPRAGGMRNGVAFSLVPGDLANSCRTGAPSVVLLGALTAPGLIRALSPHEVAPRIAGRA